jgi:hypothetical protein
MCVSSPFATPHGWGGGGCIERAKEAPGVSLVLLITDRLA